MNTPDASSRLVSDPDSYVARLAATDIPCPSCGHSMRDTTSGQCTECGSVVTLESIARGGADPIAPLPWFVATAAAGLHVVTSFEKYQALSWGVVGYQNNSISNSGVHSLLKVASVTFWLLIPLALLFLLGAQTWFARLPRKVQWTLALGFVLLALLTHRRWIIRWF
jgi:hypothetical protein